MELNQIYQPIKRELKKVEEVLEFSLGESKNESILKVNRFLLDSQGKRLRPALVILCAKATLNPKSKNLQHQLIKVATAIELIHMASLIHDDVIDEALLRHNKPTINKKWGADVSIALGDYLYSIAFELISHCGNTAILECISSATKEMCEGELVQVCERDNLELLKQKYLVIIKKKTASLFAASCQSGAMLISQNRVIQDSLREYGLNFGFAFQIVDDCLDLIGEPKELGKLPGADFKMGELTLPLLNLLSQTKDKQGLLSLTKRQDRQKAFIGIKQRFISSDALSKTKQDVYFYVQRAKKNLNRLNNSCFKDSLFFLTDYITEKVQL